MSRAAFDYERLDARRRELVRNRTVQIRRLQGRMATDAVTLGTHLAAVRELLDDAQWRGWLELVHVRPCVASNLMQAAARFAGLDCLECFQPSALYALAREGATDAARSEAIARARSGVLVTQQLARTIVAAHAPTSPASRDGSDRKHQLKHYVKRLAFVRCVVTRATANAVIDGVVAIQYMADKEPVGQSSTVAASEFHHAPAEGTA